jgi:transcriptional regulator with XRE-family HTH domain
VDQEGVGARLRQIRKLRGLSQQQLAAVTHFSVSLVKKVEQGSVPPSSAFVAVAARALLVRPSYLYGTEERDLAEQPRAELAGMAELRAALDSFDDPLPLGAPMDLAEATARLAAIARDVYRLRYAVAAQALPPLLPHLYMLAQPSGATAGRAALHDGYRLAASLAGQYRQADLAAIATERHVHLAPQTGDPLREAISAYHRTSRHLQNGDFPAGLRLLDRARVLVGTGPSDMAVATQLHLRSAVLAARAGDREGSDDYIADARELSERYGPPPSPYYNVDASPLNVSVHWCASPVEALDGAEAVRRGDQVRIVDPERPERVGHHHIDQARAWLLYGSRDCALTHLQKARRVAPQRIRRHPQVAATVRALAESDRRVTDSLAAFARWAGVEI